MGLLKLMAQVIKDNICSAAVVSRRISSRVVLDSTIESRKRIEKYGGTEEILKAFDQVEQMERRIFGYYNQEDVSSTDSFTSTEQKQAGSTDSN